MPTRQCPQMSCSAQQTVQNDKYIQFTTMYDIEKNQINQ